MKVKFNSLAAAGAFLLVMLFSPVTPVLAQEGELQVVDEVIAQINDDVLTLSRLKRESKDRIEAMKHNGVPEQQAKDEVGKKQVELMASLINETLLMQRGKELEMASEVEAEVNRRMLEVAKEQGINSIEKLDEAMRASGVDPAATRQTLRTEIMKQAVIQQEVDRKIFFGLTMDELKKYFAEHQDMFRKPENVTLSEIFLSSAGKNEAEVKARANALVAQVRAGGDFAALAATNSEREANGVRIAQQSKGKVGTFEIPSLREDIAAAVKNVRVGDVSEPLHSNDGYQILRVDERTPASTAVTFNENKVREAMTIERSPKAREEYLQNLRNEAYIKVSENYKAALMPLLKIKEEVIAEGGLSEPKPEEKKKKGRFLGIFPKP